MLNKKDLIQSLLQQYSTSLDLTKEDIVAMIDRGFIFSINDDKGNVVYDNEYYSKQEIFEARYNEFQNTKHYYTDTELLSELTERDSTYAGATPNVFNQLVERNLISEDFYYKVAEHKFLFSPDLLIKSELLKTALTELEEQLEAEEREEELYLEMDEESVSEDKKTDEKTSVPPEEEYFEEEEIFIIERGRHGKQPSEEEILLQKRKAEEAKKAEEKRLAEAQLKEQQRLDDLAKQRKKTSDTIGNSGVASVGVATGVAGAVATAAVVGAAVDAGKKAGDTIGSVFAESNNDSNKRTGDTNGAQSYETIKPETPKKDNINIPPAYDKGSDTGVEKAVDTGFKPASGFDSQYKTKPQDYYVRPTDSIKESDVGSNNNFDKPFRVEDKTSTYENTNPQPVNKTGSDVTIDKKTETPFVGGAETPSGVSPQYQGNVSQSSQDYSGKTKSYDGATAESEYGFVKSTKPEESAYVRPSEAKDNSQQPPVIDARDSNGNFVFTGYGGRSEPKEQQHNNEQNNVAQGVYQTPASSVTPAVNTQQGTQGDTKFKGYEADATKAYTDNANKGYVDATQPAVSGSDYQSQVYNAETPKSDNVQSASTPLTGAVKPVTSTETPATAEVRTDVKTEAKFENPAGYQDTGVKEVIQPIGSSGDSVVQNGSDTARVEVLHKEKEGGSTPPAEQYNVQPVVSPVIEKHDTNGGAEPRREDPYAQYGINNEIRSESGKSPASETSNSQFIDPFAPTGVKPTSQSEVKEHYNTTPFVEPVHEKRDDITPVVPPTEDPYSNYGSKQTAFKSAVSNEPIADVNYNSPTGVQTPVGTQPMAGENHNPFSSVNTGHVQQSSSQEVHIPLVDGSYMTFRALGNQEHSAFKAESTPVKTDAEINVKTSDNSDSTINKVESVPENTGAYKAVEDPYKIPTQNHIQGVDASLSEVFTEAPVRPTTIPANTNSPTAPKVHSATEDPYYNYSDNINTRSQLIAVSAGVVLSTSAISQIIDKVNSEQGFEVVITKKNAEGHLSTEEVFNSNKADNNISSIWSAYQTGSRVERLPDATDLQQAQKEQAVLFAAGVASVPFEIKDETYIPPAVPTISPKIFIEAKNSGAKYVEVNGTKVEIDEVISATASSFSVVQGTDKYCNAVIATNLINEIEANSTKNKAVDPSVSTEYEFAKFVVKKSEDRKSQVMQSFGNEKLDPVFTPAFILDKKSELTQDAYKLERMIDPTNNRSVKAQQGMKAQGQLGVATELGNNSGVKYFTGGKGNETNFVTAVSTAAVAAVAPNFIKHNAYQTSVSVMDPPMFTNKGKQDTDFNLNSPSKQTAFIDFSDPYKVEAVAMSLDVTQPDVAKKLREISREQNGDIATVLANKTLYEKQVATNVSEITQHFLNGEITLSDHSKFIANKPEYAETVAAAIENFRPAQADKIRSASRILNGEIASVLHNETIAEKRKILHTKEATILAREFLANPEKLILGNVAGVEAVARAVEETSPTVAVKLRNLSTEMNKEHKVDNTFNFRTQISKEKLRVMEYAKINKSESYGDLVSLDEERKLLKFKKISGDETLSESNIRIKGNPEQAEKIAAAIERKNPKKAEEIRKLSEELNGPIAMFYNPKLAAISVQEILKNPERNISGKAVEIEKIAKLIEADKPAEAKALRQASSTINGDFATILAITETGALIDESKLEGLGKQALSNPEQFIKGHAREIEHIATLLDKVNPERSQELRLLSEKLNGSEATAFYKQSEFVGKSGIKIVNPVYELKATQPKEHLRIVYKKDTYVDAFKNDEIIHFGMASAVGTAVAKKLSYNKNNAYITPRNVSPTVPMVSIVQKDKFGRRHVTLITTTTGSDGPRMNVTFNANRRSAFTILGYAPQLADAKTFSMPNSIINNTRFLRANLKARQIEDAQLITQNGTFTLSPEYISGLNLANPNYKLRKANLSNVAERRFERFAVSLYAVFALNKTFTTKADFEQFQTATQTGRWKSSAEQKQSAGNNSYDYEEYEGGTPMPDTDQEEQKNRGDQEANPVPTPMPGPIFTPYAIDAYDKYKLKHMKESRDNLALSPLRRYVFRRPLSGLNRTYLFAGYHSILGRQSIPVLLGNMALVSSYKTQLTDLATNFMAENVRQTYKLSDGTVLDFHSGKNRVKILKDLRGQSKTLFGQNLTNMSVTSLQKVLRDNMFNGRTLTSDQRNLLQSILLTKGINEGVFVMDFNEFFSNAGINLSKSNYRISASSQNDELSAMIGDACKNLQSQYKDVFKNVKLNDMSIEKLKELLKDPNLSADLKTKLEAIISIKELQINRNKAINRIRTAKSRIKYSIINRVLSSLNGTYLGAGISAIRNFAFKITETISIIRTLKQMHVQSKLIRIEKFRNAKPGSRAYKKYQKNAAKYEKRFQKFEGKLAKKSDKLARKQGKKNAKAAKKSAKKSARRAKRQARMAKHKHLSKVANGFGKIGRGLRSANNMRKKIVNKITAPFKKIISFVDNLKQKFLTKILLPLAKYIIIFILVILGIEIICLSASAALECVYGILYSPKAGEEYDIEWEGLSPSEYLVWDRAELCVNLDSALKHYTNQFPTNEKLAGKVKAYVKKTAPGELDSFYDPAANDKLNLTSLGSTVNGIQTGVDYSYYNGDGEEIAFKSNAKDIVSVANAWIGDSYHCRGLYKSYVEKLWNYSHAVAYSAKKQANGKYVYACDSQNASSACYGTAYTYYCNKKDKKVYTLDVWGNVTGKRTDINNGKDKATGKKGANAIQPYKAFGCKEHAMTYHKVKTGTGINYVSGPMLTVNVTTPSGAAKQVKVQTFMQWHHPNNPNKLTAPIPAPSGCSNWTYTERYYRYGDGDISKVRLYYCTGCNTAGCTNVKSVKYDAHGSINVSFHSATKFPGYTDEYGNEVYPTKALSGWFAVPIRQTQADGSVQTKIRYYYLEGTDSSKPYNELYTPEVLEIFKYFASPSWVLSAYTQYNACKANGCLRTVYHYNGSGPVSAGSAYRSCIGTSNSLGCSNAVLRSDGKYWCQGHYVCSGIYSNTSIPLNGTFKYCGGCCDGHTIQNYCKGHVDINVSTVTLFIEDNNSLLYLGVPKKVTSEEKEITVTKYGLEGNVKQTSVIESEAKSASGAVEFLYKDVPLFKDSSLFNYKEFPLLDYYQNQVEDFELVLKGPEVVDPGNSGNALSTASWIPAYVQWKGTPNVTMNDILKGYYQDFNEKEWYDHNDATPDHVKDIRHIKSLNNKFGKNHYFGGWAQYDSSGNIIMNGSEPADTGRMARARQVFDSDWYEAYRIPFPGSYNVLPQWKELKRLYKSMSDGYKKINGSPLPVSYFQSETKANSGSATPNKVESIIADIGKSYSGSALQYAVTTYQSTKQTLYGSQNSAVNSAFNSAKTKTDYHDQLLEFRKILGVKAIGTNTGLIHKVTTGDILGIGDEVYIVLYSNAYTDDDGNAKGYVYVTTANTNTDTIHQLAFSSEYLKTIKDIVWIYDLDK